MTGSGDDDKKITYAEYVSTFSVSIPMEECPFCNAWFTSLKNHIWCVALEIRYGSAIRR
jgi:transposase-like protein